MNQQSKNTMASSSEFVQAARVACRMSIFTGAILVPLGILSFLAPMITGMTITVLLGALLIAAGVVEMAFSFKMKAGIGKRLFGLLGGLLVLVAGGITIVTPVKSLLVITMLVAVLFAVIGVTSIIRAVRLRSERGWLWAVSDGIICLMVAMLIFAQWPLSGAWALGVLIGARLLTHGVALIAVGSTGKRMITDLQDARVDDLERNVQSVSKALRASQVVLAGQSAALLALDTQLRKKVSVSDVDPDIQALNRNLGEARRHMEAAAAATRETWDRTQKEAEAAFDKLGKSTAEITERLKRELAIE